MEVGFGVISDMLVKISSDEFQNGREAFSAIEREETLGILSTSSTAHWSLCPTGFLEVTGIQYRRTPFDAACSLVATHYLGQPALSCQPASQAWIMTPINCSHTNCWEACMKHRQVLTICYSVSCCSCCGMLRRLKVPEGWSRFLSIIPTQLNSLGSTVQYFIYIPENKIHNEGSSVGDVEKSLGQAFPAGHDCVRAFFF